MSDDLETRLALLLEIIDPSDNPNHNVLLRLLKDIEFIKLNIKSFGYELGRQLAAALPIRDGLRAQHVGLKCKPSTQMDLESDWAAYWLAELKLPVVFHRKLWEFAFVLQALHEHGMIASGRRGLGFGCGVEPLPSYLASHNVDVVVTDMPLDDQATAGWAQFNQHADSLNVSFKSELVSRELFDRHVSLRFVNMNAIPNDLIDYDFCWSICALEHLGSIEKGIAFIENAMLTVKPGGLGIHTTEFNFLNDGKTIDHWGYVLFQSKHFIQMRDRLMAKGYDVADLDFDYGSKPMDKFIDIPPHAFEWPARQRELWGSGSDHLKLATDGVATTCYGIIVRKPA